MSAGDDERLRGWEERWSSAECTARWRTTSIPPEIREAAEEAWFPPGGRVLDIGCGSGEIAAWLAGQGYEVVGVDFSPSAIATAVEEHARLPGLTFEVVDIGERAPEGRFTPSSTVAASTTSGMSAAPTTFST